MLLVIDVGNSHTVFGFFEGQELVLEARLVTNQDRTQDEYWAFCTQLLEKRLAGRSPCTGCVVCSVVPPVTTTICSFVSEELKVHPIVVGPGTKTGLPIKIAEPNAVGADRVVNALAVRELHGCPALVVDFGTATSIDFVDSEGAYQGGVIAPGVNTALDALVQRTAKLPRIEISWPKHLIGKSTVQAMQSGAVAGYHYMVDGLIEGIIKEVGPIDHIVSTGGLGQLFSQHSKLLRHYDPALTLRGMRIIALNNGLSDR